VVPIAVASALLTAAVPVSAAFLVAASGPAILGVVHGVVILVGAATVRLLTRVSKVSTSFLGGVPHAPLSLHGAVPGSVPSILDGQ